MPSPQPQMFWTLITLNWQVQFQNTIFGHLNERKSLPLHSSTDFLSEFIHLFCPYKMDTFSCTKLHCTKPQTFPSLSKNPWHCSRSFTCGVWTPEQAPMTRCAVGKAREMTPSPLGGMEGRKPSHDFWSQVSHENNLLAFHYTGCSIWIIIMVYIYIYMVYCNPHMTV